MSTEEMSTEEQVCIPGGQERDSMALVNGADVGIVPLNASIDTKKRTTRSLHGPLGANGRRKIGTLLTIHAMFLALRVFDVLFGVWKCTTMVDMVLRLDVYILGHVHM
jgi:hypothetical protein